MAPAGYTARLVAGVMVPTLTVVSAVLFWIGAYAVAVHCGRARGIRRPAAGRRPALQASLFLVFLYQSAGPLHAARRASYQELGGPHHAAVAALDGLLSVGVGNLIVWPACQSMPEVRELLGPLLDV